MDDLSSPLIVLCMGAFHKTYRVVLVYPLHALSRIYNHVNHEPEVIDIFNRRSRIDLHLELSSEHLIVQNTNQCIQEKLRIIYLFFSKSWPFARYILLERKNNRVNINRASSLHSVIIITIIVLTEHKFDWKNVHMLDEELSYVKRCISEMLHAKQQKNGIDLQENMSPLD